MSRRAVTMRHLARYPGAVFVIAIACLAIYSTGFAATNAWVPPTSGDWHVATSWSFGTLPSSSQSILIDAPGWKAVAITPVTSANYPGSLTVQDLRISNNSTQDLNTLLLNYTGATTPLRVLNGLSVQNGARIVNFNSALVVESGSFVITNAEVIQDGGLVQTTNATIYLGNAAYYLTNGVFEAGSLFVTPTYNNTFNQYGGSATFRQLNFAQAGGGASYVLSGGQLKVQVLDMTVDNNGVSSFVQSGGTNNALELLMYSELYGGTVDYTLNAGLLETSNTVVFGGGHGATFRQNAGIHNCTHEVVLDGFRRHATGDPMVGSYILTDGQFSTPSLVVRPYGSFKQSGGFASISGALQFGTGSYDRWSSSLSGGTLACSNIQSSGIGVDFVQTGGALIVTNLLSFSGAAACCNPAKVPTYTFSGGTIIASNMEIGTFLNATNIPGYGELGAEFILEGSATFRRISNPGYFSLGGNLRLGDVNEQLGSFILGGPSILDFGPGNATLRFAPSSAQIWNTNLLRVINWAGSPAGGGNDQLKFGSNASGLSPKQLQQIVFSNPSGFDPGDYPAQILSTGEIIPTAGTSLTASQSGTNLVLNWPAGWSLQSATNVAGPYADIPNATPPYTNQITEAPQSYFRLRR